MVRTTKPHDCADKPLCNTLYTTRPRRSESTPTAAPTEERPRQRTWSRTHCSRSTARKIEVEIKLERTSSKPSTKQPRKRLTSRQRQRRRKSGPTRPRPRTRTRSTRRPSVTSAKSTVKGIPQWWELSAEELYGEMLLRKTWHSVFNRRRCHKIHFILTEEHKQLPIIENQAGLNLVSKTGNFIPIPSAQNLIRNIPVSLNILFVRIPLGI